MEEKMLAAFVWRLARSERNNVFGIVVTILIEDICVAKLSRAKGVGTCGFVIGAVNTMLYKSFGNDEFAVFWYLPFRNI